MVKCWVLRCSMKGRERLCEKNVSEHNLVDKRLDTTDWDQILALSLAITCYPSDLEQLSRSECNFSAPFQPSGSVPHLFGLLPRPWERP